MARAGDMSQFKGVGFRSPRFLHSDHRAVVANIWVGRKGRLKNYRRARQKFPLSLPIGPKDANTTTFDALAATCVDPKTTWAPGKDWVSEGTWKLIAKRASLLRSGKIRQTQGSERNTSRHGFAGQRRKRTLRKGQITLAPGNRGVSL